MAPLGRGEEAEERAAAAGELGAGGGGAAAAGGAEGPPRHGGAASPGRSEAAGAAAERGAADALEEAALAAEARRPAGVDLAALGHHSSGAPPPSPRGGPSPRGPGSPPSKPASPASGLPSPRGGAPSPRSGAASPPRPRGAPGAEEGSPLRAPSSPRSAGSPQGGADGSLESEEEVEESDRPGPRQQLARGFAGAAQTLRHHLMVCLKILGDLFQIHISDLKRLGNSGGQPAKQEPAAADIPGLRWRPLEGRDALGHDAERGASVILLLASMAGALLAGALRCTKDAQARCVLEFPNLSDCQQDELLSFDGTLTTVYEGEDASTKQGGARLPQELPVSAEEHRELKAEHGRLLAAVADGERRRDADAARLKRLEETRQALREEAHRLDCATAAPRPQPALLEELGVVAQCRDAYGAYIADEDMAKLEDGMQRLTRQSEEWGALAAELRAREQEALDAAREWEASREAFAQQLRAASEEWLPEGHGSDLPGLLRGLLAARSAAERLRRQRSEEERLAPRRQADDIEEPPLQPPAPAAPPGRHGAAPRPQRSAAPPVVAKLQALSARFVEAQQLRDALLAEGGAPSGPARGGRAPVLGCSFSEAALSSRCSGAGSPGGSARAERRPGAAARPGSARGSRGGRLLEPRGSEGSPPASGRSAAAQLGPGLAEWPRTAGGAPGPAAPSGAPARGAAGCGAPEPPSPDSRLLSQAAVRYVKNPGDGQAVEELVSMLCGDGGAPPPDPWLDQQPAPEPQPGACATSPAAGPPGSGSGPCPASAGSGAPLAGGSAGPMPSFAAAAAAAFAGRAGPPAPSGLASVPLSWGGRGAAAAPGAWGPPRRSASEAALGAAPLARRPQAAGAAAGRRGAGARSSPRSPPAPSPGARAPRGFCTFGHR